ncbi:MAG: transglycosylase domain-containing protein [Actinomycetota bacterium]
MHRFAVHSSRRFLLAVLAAVLVATSCSVETKDFDALFGEDFSITALETAQSSRVFDRNGDLIVELRGEQNRTDVSLDDMAQVMIDAVVAIEDERFWDHSGVDLKAILRAARSNVNAGGISQGGSTITQQYVGNVFLDRSEQTGSRKVEEIFMARRFEQRYTKEFILERYLNWVFFGRGAYGVEAAARTYFGAPDCDQQQNAFVGQDDRECLKVSELSIVEAATIAGLIQAPSRFNPFRDYEAARDRRDLVLLRMYANDYITEEEYEQALLQPIDLIEDVPILEEEYPAAHFVEDVKQWFLDNPQFGPTREARTTLLFEGGLDIYTTIDLGLQAEAEAKVEQVLPQVAADGSLNPDAAAVIMGTTDADDGHILAMVGGRDFFGADDDAKFNLASGPGRQAGSSMKPIGLAAALQIGIPITRFYDATSPIEIENRPVCGPKWRVRGGAEGDRTLADATKWSRNKIYAQLMVDIGPPRFVDMAEALGIGEDRIQPVCAAILGTENVNMVELSTVYATFSRDGVRVDPVLVTRIDNPDGTQLYENISVPDPVLNKTVNDQLTWSLSTVMSGTGWRAALDDWPSAGKTGTAQNNADATFAGYTRQRAAAVWVGYPEEQIPMRTQFEGGKVEGGTFPALIWHELMTAAMQGFEAESFPTPPGSSTTTTLPEIPEEAEVPSLIGQEITQELYDQLIDEPNYWVLELVEVETRNHEAGKVFNQVPAAGQIVPGGSTITLEIAVEPELLAVPSVIGLSEAEAKQQIAAAGYGVSVEIVADPDGGDTPSPGIVWSQSPEAGTLDDTIQVVSIQVNPGTAPTTTTSSTTTSSTTTTTAAPGDGDG